MGLDMYLSRATYVKNWDHMVEENLHQISVKLAKKKHPYINVKDISEVTEEIGYWRKANAIHQWFVTNCQDGVDKCQRSDVSWEQLEELLNICEEIKENPERASVLLPTQSGFFFGSTEYDDYYLQDIDSTIKILKPLVELNNQLMKNRKDGKRNYDIPEYHYQASW